MHPFKLNRLLAASVSTLVMTACMGSGALAATTNIGTSLSNSATITTPAQVDAFEY